MAEPHEYELLLSGIHANLTTIPKTAGPLGIRTEKRDATAHELKHPYPLFTLSSYRNLTDPHGTRQHCATVSMEMVNVESLQWSLSTSNNRKAQRWRRFTLPRI